MKIKNFIEIIKAWKFTNLFCAEIYFYTLELSVIEIIKSR